MLVGKLLSTRGAEAGMEQLRVEPLPASSPAAPLAEPIPVATSMPVAGVAVEATAAPATCVTYGATVSEKVRD